MNKIAANAARFIRIVTKNFKSITIEAIKTVFGTKPQKPFLVLHTAYYCIIGKTVFNLVMPKIVGLRSSGEADHTQDGNKGCFKSHAGSNF